ncbi:MAG: ABC transporter ATP-binding protein [Luteolibacter sp.]
MEAHPQPPTPAEFRGLVLRILRENFRLYVGRYVLAFLLMAVSAGATGFSVFLMRDILRVVFTPRGELIHPANDGPAGLTGMELEWLGRLLREISTNWQPGVAMVVAVAVAILVVFAVKGLSHYGATVILSKIGNNIVARQQVRLANHLLGQPLAFFSRFPSGGLLTRASSSARAARDVMNLLMTRVQDVFTAIALLAAMFTLDWKLSAAAVFIIAPIVILLGKIIRRIRKVAGAEFMGNVRIVSVMQEAIFGNKLIKSYTLEGRMRDRFKHAIADVERRSNKLAVVASRTGPIMEFMGGLAIAGIVLYGGYRNVVLGQSAESLIAFLTAVLLAYEPIKRIARMNVSLQAALVSVKMLYEVLDTDFRLPAAENPQPLSLEKGTIDFRNVSFSYLPGIPVLNDITLTCPGGSVTALVGPSGSGKSTVLNLIERFHDPDNGAVLIDGQDLRGLALDSLRSQMSLVSQDTFLFSDTLRNNIRVVRPEATDVEVEAAARAAFAHDFILEQAQGYDTQIGENGANLSGGQRQRISIARAFLRNAPILLLDEATSALDSESEQQIQLAFDGLMKGRTTIVIAHRFSTIRNARVIHVLQDGRLVASGSHEELMLDSNGLYAMLQRLQGG